MNSSNKNIIIAIVVIAVVALGAWYYYVYYYSVPLAAPAGQQPAGQPPVSSGDTTADIANDLNSVSGDSVPTQEMDSLNQDIVNF